PAREVIDCGLGRRIPHHTRERTLGGHRGDVHDGAATALGHGFAEYLGGEERAHEVEVEYLTKGILLQSKDALTRLEGSRGHVPACAVDEDVDLPESIEDGVAHGQQRLLLKDIGFHSNGCSARLHDG